ncbi:hypothetical protein K2P47_01545 [Patescibacteria group bacterium]|nr:hypothetical protein [Patescibacteria group bacterium]
MLSSATKLTTKHSVELNYSSLLPLATVDMWELLKKTQTLRDVAKGFVTYHGELPEEWEVGTKVDIRPKFLKLPWSLLPEGRHLVEVIKVDHNQLFIETVESGGVVEYWHHVMKIEPVPGCDFCMYTDTILLEAGWATGIVARIADSLYRHRHERWLEIATAQQ